MTIKACIAETVREWTNLFQGYLESGFSKKDIIFEIQEDGPEIKVTFSKKLYTFLAAAANHHKDALPFFQFTTRKSGSKVHIWVKCVDNLYCPINYVIALSFQIIIRKKADTIRKLNKEKRDGKKICREKDEISTRAIALPIKIVRVKNNPHFHKVDGVYVLWADLGNGEKRIIGKNPDEIIQKIERLLDK